jgi:hypothetical protein
MRNSDLRRRRIALSLSLSPSPIMESFDVVSLFTTTPVDKSLLIVKSKLQEDVKLNERTILPIDTIMEKISVCVNNTYFQYGKYFYKQQKGMVMGSPLSPVICNLFREDLETRALSSFTPKPEVFFRYIDDIFFVWLSEFECSISEFHVHLNNQDCNSQFTMEMENNGKIPFLDVLVSRGTGRLVTEVYRKATNSDLYLQ